MLGMTSLLNIYTSVNLCIYVSRYMYQSPVSQFTESCLGFQIVDHKMENWFAQAWIYCNNLPIYVVFTIIQ